MSSQAINEHIARYKTTTHNLGHPRVQRSLAEVNRGHQVIDRELGKFKKSPITELKTVSVPQAEIPAEVAVESKKGSQILGKAKALLNTPAGKIAGGTIGGVFFGAVEIALEPERYNGNDNRANYRKAATFFRNAIAGLVSGGAAGITGLIGIPTTGPLGAGAAFVVGMGVYQGINYPLVYMADKGELIIFGDEAKLQDFAKGLPNDARFTGLKFLPLAAEYSQSAQVSKPREK